MRERAPSNPLRALRSLRSFLPIFLAVASACQNDGDGGANTPPVALQTAGGGGSCSNEAEFLAIFKRDRLAVATTSDDLAPSEIAVGSFDVGAPITYSTVYNGRVLEIHPAYPVTADWTMRQYRFNRVSESDYRGGSFYCYANPEDYASKFPPEDPRFPKHACVCIAQNLEAVGPAKERECPYDESNPNKTCPAD